MITKRILALLSIFIGVLFFSQHIHAKPALKVLMQEQQGNQIHINIAPGESPNSQFRSGLAGVSITPVDMESWVIAAWRVHSKASGWSDWQDTADGPLTLRTYSDVNAVTLALADVEGQWEISYRIHQGARWSDWHLSGEPAGDPIDGGRINALQIKLHDLSSEVDTMLRGQYLALGGNEEDKAPISMFDDEAQALKAVQQNPSSENLMQLAQIRYAHAVDLVKIAEEQGDIDAMELALQYANGAIEADPYEAAYWQLIGAIHARFVESDEQQLAALNAYNRALELQPENPAGLLLLTADVEQRLGLVGGASLHLYQAMKVNPENITQTRLGLMVSACTEGQIQQKCRYWLGELRPESNMAPAMQIADALLLIDIDPGQAMRLLKLVSERGTEQQTAYADMLMKEIKWQEANR